MDPSVVFPLLFVVQLLVIVGRILLSVLLVLDLVLRVPETDCGLVYYWLGVRQYVLLLSVLYALVSNLLGNGDSLTLTSA
jgi:hypothetical protein